jgi:CRP-like cAMP-binding protein
LTALAMPELNIVERVIALEAVDLLRNLNPDQLARIATIAKEVSFPAGETILDASRPNDALYVILDGVVELISLDAPAAGGDRARTLARRNDVLGAWALFDAEPLRVQARVLDPALLLRIGRDDFYDLLSDNAEITASIFSILVRRFRDLLEGV